MRESPGFRSAEEVQAAAMTEFNVDLKDRGAVMAKARELNEVARRAGSIDYTKVERLTQLLDVYDQMTGGTKERAVAKAA